MSRVDFGCVECIAVWLDTVLSAVQMFRPDQNSNPTPYEHFVDLGCDSVFSRKLLIVIKGNCKKGSGRLYGNTLKNANLIPYVAYLEVSSPLQEVDP